MDKFLITVFKNSFISTRNDFASNPVTFLGSFNNLKCKLSSMKGKQLRVQNINYHKSMSIRQYKSLNEMKDHISKSHLVTFEEVPVKSDSDKKEYLVIILENGLKGLLISEREKFVDQSDSTDLYNEAVDASEKFIKSDKSEKFAACALTVGVGSFSDPEKIPGLAHFLEHMVFMGSKKFPKENDFHSYLKKRGGSANAFTDSEITSFYFTCPNKHLRKIMERFANFFVAPLMNNDSMAREREIIDSEFQQNPSLDSARIEEIIYSTAPLNNPVHKFSWGNLITLKQNVNDDELLQSLKEFWKNHYSANHMTVAVQATLPLDVIGKWVAEYFGEINSNSKPPITFPDVNPPFDMDLFHKIYTVQPVEDSDHLILTWAFPSVKHLYKSKPLSYYTFLIGHKGAGSLFSYLHEKMWIMDVSVSSRNTESNSVFSMMSVDFILTKSGLQNFEQIITLVFSYLKLLLQVGPSKAIFREFQVVEDLKFRFQDGSEASDYVQELSCNMQIYPPKHYITGDKLLFEYQPKEISKILKLMKPKNINIMILSKSAAQKVTLDKTEFWFQTKYNTENVSETLITQWENCKLNSKLRMPKPNVYIPENFYIISAPGERLQSPQNILRNDLIEVWYKPDSKFKLPHGYVAMYLISPVTLLLPQNTIMCDFLLLLFSYLTINESYPAGFTGLDISFSSGYSGIILKINGFNDKITLLLEIVLKKIMSFVKNKSIPEQLFNMIKEHLRNDYYNSILDPSGLSHELFLSIICTPYWGSISKLESIDIITTKKFQEFVIEFFKNLYIKTLIQGNISIEKAINISNLIQQLINYKPILMGTHPVLRTRVLPIGETIIRVQSFNAVDTNCNVTNYYQYGQSPITERCVLLTLLFIMEEPLFDTLRTKSNIAYYADCQFKDNRGITGLTVTVSSQADKFSVQHVENKITLFLNAFTQDIKNMTEEDFNRNKESLKSLLLIEDPNLMHEFQRNWAEIISDEYMFDRIDKYITCINSIKSLCLIKVLNKIIGKNINKKDDVSLIRKLSIQVDGANGDRNYKDSRQTQDNTSKVKHSLQIKTSENENKEYKFIKDIEDFKRKMDVYPNKNN